MKLTTRLLAGISAAIMLLASGCSDGTAKTNPSGEPQGLTIPSLSPEDTVMVIPAPEGAEIGLVDTHYSLSGGTSVILGECSGDTDVLKPVGVRATFDCLSQLLFDNFDMEFVFDAKFPVAFTANQYERGEVISDGDVQTFDAGGYMEKLLDNGRWLRQGSAMLKTPNPGPLADASVSATDPIGPDESNIPRLSDNAVRVRLPLKEPGRYRYTLYFRESIDHDKKTLTTGEKLYSVTMEVIIPKSDKNFDFVAFGVGSGIGIDGKFVCEMWTVLRANKENGQIYYNAGKGGTLEKLEGEEWVEIKDGVHKATGEDKIQWDFAYSNQMPHLRTNQVFYPTTEEGEYRLTLPFTDKGKNYDLILYLSLD